MLQRPGTWIWLVPMTVMQREIDRPGFSSAYDLLSRCLPIGTVAAPLDNLAQAIAHVRHHQL